MKIKRFSVLILLLSLLVCGCQQTPTETYVTQKGVEQPLPPAVTEAPETVQFGAAEAPEEPPAPQLIAPPAIDTSRASQTLQQLKATVPAEYAEQVTGETAHLTLDIRAAVELPEGDGMPIVYIGRSPLTEADIAAFDAATQDGRIPVAYGFATRASITKGTLNGLKAQRARGELDKYSSLDALDRAIAEVEAQAAAAPTEIQRTEPVYAFNADGDYTGMRLSEEGDSSFIFVMRTRATYERKHVAQPYIIYDCSSQWITILQKQQAVPAEAGISKDAAEDLARAAVSTMVSEDYVLSDYRKLPVDNDDGTGYTYKHEFIFTRNYNGASVNFTQRKYSQDPNTSYTQPWPVEYIRVFADDAGLFSILWNGRYELLGYQNYNTAMVPFAEIMELFKSRAMMTYGNYTGEESRTVTVERIVLGLGLVQEKNGDNAYLVPVWDFYGTLPDDAIPAGADGLYSLLTVNAIDGSVMEFANIN